MSTSKKTAPVKSATTVSQQMEASKPLSDDIYTISGKSMYARLFEPQGPGKMYPDQAPRWCTDLLLDKEGIARARALGLKVKSDKETYTTFCQTSGLVQQGYEGDYISIKKSTIRKQYDKAAGRPVKDKFGQNVFENAPWPKVFDSQGNEIPESTALRIGNGSDLKVSFSITKPQGAGPGNFGARLISSRILNLVPYVNKDAGTFVYSQSNDGAFNSSDEHGAQHQAFEADFDSDDDDKPF